MNTLDILYEQKIQHSTFLERKVNIQNPFTLLFGPKLSGKTYLIYDYLNNHASKKYLYIDMYRLKGLDFEPENLENFIKLNNIEILVIENFNFAFNLPNVSSIILSCESYKEIENFCTLKVMPLDFEEYLSFDIKHQNTTNSFNSFLKYGNIAQVINYKDINKQNRNNEIMNLTYKNETKSKIYELLIKNSSQIKSTYWLYTVLKKTMKISKDIFYQTIKEFEQNKTILFCPKYNANKSTQKVFTYNHAFIDAVTYNKNFSYIFLNMIYLELYTKYNEIFYADNIDFYIEDNQNIVLSIPFYNSNQISSISSKILKTLQELNCTKIFIITISNQDEIFIDDIACEVLPFYEWALIS